MSNGANLTAKIQERTLEQKRVHLRYPVITGLPDNKVAQKISLRIQDLFYQLITEQGYTKDPAKEFWGSYKVRVNKNGVLSLTIDVYSYSKGMAHGITVQKGLTFDLETGHEYTFSELFLPNSNYKEIINAEIKRQIKERQIPLIADFTTIKDNPDYYLTAKEVVIFFQLYEHTPYYWGFPEFPIPFTLLRPVINPQGPIAKLQKG